MRSADKVPQEYWEYRILKDFFGGNWLAYINTPEYMVERIIAFMSIEAEAEYGNRPTDSN